MSEALPGSGFIDLHTHSNFSDGSCTPAEIVAMAAKAGLAAVALTDHDTTAGIPEFLQAAEATPELEAIAGEDAFTWGEEIEVTAEVCSFGDQPFVCCTETSYGETVIRYYRTVHQDRWFFLSLYTSASGAPLTEDELAALDKAASTLSFDGVEQTAVSSSDVAYMVLFAVGIVLFLLTVILLARSVRRAPKQPPVLPGFLCRVSTPAGLMDFYGRYFVLFPAWGEPVSYLYEQTGGVLEAERCFWVYPPNRAPIPVPKNAFLAGEPEKLRPLCGGTERRS